MDKTLYLHIGHYKTGTTYFQEKIYANRQALQDAGVIYPEEGLGLDTRHNQFAHRLIGLKFNRQGYGTLQNICQNLQNDKQLKAALVSYEGFANPLRFEDIEKSHFTKLGVQVKVVLVLRPHVDFAISMYRELVQNLYYCHNFQDFCTRTLSNEDPWHNIFNYTYIYKYWCDLVGKDNVTIVNFDDIKSDIVDGILSAFGEHMTLTEEPSAKIANPTYHGAAIELARRLNVAGVEQTRGAAKTLSKIRSKRFDFSKTCELSLAEAIDLNKRFEADRQALVALGFDFAADWSTIKNWRWAEDCDLEEAVNNALPVLYNMINRRSFRKRMHWFSPLFPYGVGKWAKIKQAMKDLF